jgi:hypothetical protein
MKTSLIFSAAVAAIAVAFYVVVVLPEPTFFKLAPAELLDELLEKHHRIIGADYTAYRNHCLRVYNLAVLISQRRAPLDEGAAAKRNELFQIATAFHDIGLWTDNMVAYLAPSERRAAAWLSAQGRQRDIELVTALIEEHHKMTTYSGPAVVNDFVQADWNDVMLGLVTFGNVTREEIKGLQATFPNAGFHARLCLFGFEQMRNDPLNPLPMFKW